MHPAGRIVSAADTMWRRSPRQQEGVRPEIGAVVTESLRSSRSFAELLPKAEPTRDNRIADAYAEIVFRNPDDGQFVLLPFAWNSRADEGSAPTP
jgi:hypothetical protein